MRPGDLVAYRDRLKELHDSLMDESSRLFMPEGEAKYEPLDPQTQQVIADLEAQRIRMLPVYVAVVKTCKAAAFFQAWKLALR